jgi:hypothetical protein
LKERGLRGIAEARPTSVGWVVRALPLLSRRSSAARPTRQPAAWGSGLQPEEFVMKQVKCLMAACLSLGGLLAAGPALAEEFRCAGSVGAVALDNVFVPDGASCVLDRTRLNGSLVVGRGASLQARSVSVNGNVQAEGAAWVGLGGFSTVGGSVQIVQGGGAAIERARIKGDLQFESNTGALSARGNTIGGNLQVFQNMGGVRLFNNRMNGNMQCKENIPAPVGSGNVSPSKEDQCAAL